MGILLEWLQGLYGAALTWFGGVFVVMGLVRVMTRRFDRDLDPDWRDGLALRLLDFTPEATGAWVWDFNRLFDRVFGEEHFRARCFGLSMLISSVSYIFIFWLLMVLYGLELRSEDAWLYFVVVPLFGLMCNGLVDYASLLETRWLLGTRLPYRLKLVLDVVLTTGLTLVWAVLFLSLFRLAPLESSVALLLNFPVLAAKDQVLLLATFITSFTTSVWLWLYGGAYLTLRVLRPGARLMQILNVAEAPLGALGVVAAFYVGLGGCVIFLGYVVGDLLGWWSM